MDADALELIGADTVKSCISGHIEIVLEKTIGEVAHRQSCSIDTGEQHCFVSHQDERRMQFMCPPTQIAQLFGRRGAACRLAEALEAARQCLIGTHTARPGNDDAMALALARARCRATAARLSILASASMARSSTRDGLISNRNPAAAENFSADIASRRKHQRLGRKPERHELCHRVPAPFTQEPHHRSGGLLD